MTFAPQISEGSGTISEILAQSIITNVENDGDHTYLHIQEESKTQLPVNNEAISVRVPLTNVALDVAQFDKSFITLKVEVPFKLSAASLASSTTDTSSLAKAIDIFIGLKHATDCLGEYSVYHKGKQISGTLQSNGTTESFLYHTYRSEEDLANRRGTHTIAKAAAKDELNSVCGDYITLGDLKKAANNGIITKSFNLIIPFNDILAFQDFRSYPSALFGELELRFKFNKNAFVCLPCDPVACIKAAQARHQYASSDSLASLNSVTVGGEMCGITREYTQVGDSFSAVTAASNSSNALSLTVSTISLTPQSMSIKECFSTIVGYRMNREALEAERMKYENTPWVKFSQSVNFLPFSSAPGTTKIDISQQTYLNNVTDLVLMFPRSQHESGGTVSKNPMLQDLSLTVMNRKYPEMPLDTTSPRFAQMMLNASDSFHKTPNREYAQSISVYRYDESGKIIPEEDLTSFLVTLKVERPSAMGLICDGLDSQGQQVSVRLNATPKSTSSAVDEYCAQNLGIPPVLITVNDSFYIFSSRNGGECIYSDRDFNSVCSAFMGSE